MNLEFIRPNDRVYPKTFYFYTVTFINSSVLIAKAKSEPKKEYCLCHIPDRRSYFQRDIRNITIWKRLWKKWGTVVLFKSNQSNLTLSLVARSAAIRAD